MLELFGHPFSSYTWKALIALYENNTDFTFRMIDPEHQNNTRRVKALSPQGKFPVLIDTDRVICESSIIIEYLHCFYPGAVALLPADPQRALQVRTLDRFFDNDVMAPVQRIVNDFMHHTADRDAPTVSSAHAALQRSYDWLNRHLESESHAEGDRFSLADCAAAPSRFYADWVGEIDQKYTQLRSYRARLLARPSIRRCVEEARPYRSLFPPGLPAGTDYL